tara:strand:+ start:4462 stop:4914 length:453 start_codon:yes stop_codon:yes gene_type:complete
MNKVKAADLQYGLSMEQKAQPQLELVFGKLYNNNNHFKYHPIDFKTDKYIETDKERYAVEYKRRRIYFGQHPTLMVNKSKIIKGREYIERGMRVFYTWECNDDWYCWELNESQLSWGTGGTNKRGCEEWVDVAHINNEFISKLSDLSIHN